jgi:phosphatidylglycerophosphate synthase
MLARLPNAITSLRIAAIPALVWLAVARRHGPFAAILVASLVGDIVDGLLARLLRATSSLGAALDSIADTLLFFVAAFGALVFYPEVLRAHPAVFALVPALWAAENAAALLRYGRLSSFHTYASRVAAYALGLFIGVLFLFGFSAALMTVAVASLVLATAEEFVLLWLLPTWTPDVRGAWWVLRRRRAGGPAGGAS